MERIKVLIICSVVLFSCVSSPYKESHETLRKCKASFDKKYRITNLFDHFPDQDISQPILYYGVQLMPTYKYIRGYLYQFVRYENDSVGLCEKIKEDVLYNTKYANQDNIFIDFIGFSDVSKPDPKSNKWYKDKYPIPYLGNVNLGLGETFEEKIDDKGKKYRDYNSIIPEDLEMFVIDAQLGYFWKGDSDSKRPESLKEWKNGYSRGYAISKKEKMIVYWTIIW